MEQLIQKKLFFKKTFTFKKTGIEIVTKDSDGESSIFVHFDKIEPRENIRVHTKQKSVVLRVGLLLSVITLIRGFLTANTDTRTTITIVIISLVMAALTYAIFYFTKKKYYLIDLEEKAFFILYDKPNNEIVNAFIDEIFSRRREYYRDTYFEINYENERAKEINKMKWLRAEDIITENEFNVVIDEINENIHD